MSALRLVAILGMLVVGLTGGGALEVNNSGSTEDTVIRVLGIHNGTMNAGEMYLQLAAIVDSWEATAHPASETTDVEILNNGLALDVNNILIGIGSMHTEQTSSLRSGLDSEANAAPRRRIGYKKTPPLSVRQLLGWIEGVRRLPCKAGTTRLPLAKQQGLWPITELVIPAKRHNAATGLTTMATGLWIAVALAIVTAQVQRMTPRCPQILRRLRQASATKYLST